MGKLSSKQFSDNVLELACNVLCTGVDFLNLTVGPNPKHGEYFLRLMNAAFYEISYTNHVNFEVWPKSPRRNNPLSALNGMSKSCETDVIDGDHHC